MIANFHTHTYRCHHGEGTEEEYVRCGVEAGLQILGISDHAPYVFPADYCPPFRMSVGELGDYVAAVEAARKRYGHQISIPLGVEAEFYPRFFRDTVALLRDHGIEYMLLGQHMLFNEIEGISTAPATADAALLRQYCDQTVDAIYTGLFTYFAHPDIMNFVGDRGVYREQMGRICRAAKACDLPLEINLLGIQLQRQYPCEEFWHLAAEEGCKVVLGIDAHKPEALLDTHLESKARALAAKFDLEILETVPLKRL